MNFAPVLLFVYNRPYHTRRTIEALQKNNLAKDTELYIYSDGPKTESDVHIVNQIRAYLKTVEGFKDINCIEREKNLGLANSIISGVNEIINIHKKVIVVEDDLVSSVNFIKFMNGALDFYEDNKKIFSLSGYSFPIKIPNDYTKDVYILPRVSTWGWGTWKNRWEKTDWDVSDFNEFKDNKLSQRLFNRGGNDLTPMLKAQMNGDIDSWGIRWSYFLFKNDGYCLYPVKSKIMNIGTDKSGTHIKKTNRFNITLDDGKYTTKFVQDLELNSEILKEFQTLINISLFRKMINFLKYN